MQLTPKVYTPLGVGGIPYLGVFTSLFILFQWYPTASRAQTRAMAAAASAAGGAAGAAPRSRGSSLAARQQADYMNPNCACTLGPLPAEAKNAANALSDERPTRLSENLRICYPHLTAKSDQYGNRTTAETQLVQVKEGCLFGHFQPSGGV